MRHGTIVPYRDTCTIKDGCRKVNSARTAANLESGRVRQKLRTRDQLVASTIKMVRAGRTPTVAEVADEAGGGRTTAYRYFPTPESLLAEAVLSLVGEPDDRSLYEHLAETTAIEERLD